MSMLEQFEEWARDKELSLDKNPRKLEPQPMYDDIETEMFWECWQAAVRTAETGHLSSGMTNEDFTWPNAWSKE